MNLFNKHQNTNFIPLPGSKSIINRLLTLALYHNINLHIENINLCDDVKEMLSVYTAIGKRYEICDTTLNVYAGFTDTTDEINITITASGTCLRFILPFLALVYGKKCYISLGDRLAKRPLQPLIDCLVNAGADIVMNDVTGTLFIASTKNPVDTFIIDSSTSSQFLSALMLYCSYYQDTKIIGGDTATSHAYIRMTREVIHLLPQPPLPHSTISLKLDPDYSTACYVWLYSYLQRKEIFIAKLTNIYQPDYKFVAIMWELGIDFIEKDGYISVSLDSPFPCSHDNISVDMSDLPDQIITLAFLCLIAGVRAEISGCGSLRYKESDRIAGILENVALLGGEASFADNVLYIEPLSVQPSACMLKTYHDHRFACVFWVLQQKFTFLEVDDVECVSKSL